MRVVVLQPSYLPWLGYLEQMNRADVFVYYDDVQYDRDGWRNRNRIRTQRGWEWLTVPVRLKGRSGSLVNEVAIDDRRGWARKHLATLRQSYAQAPYLSEHLPRWESILHRKWTKLVDLNITLTSDLAAALGIATRTLRSSELDVPGTKSERLLAICRKLGATKYLSGDAAKAYLDVSSFESAGIEVEFVAYRHPVYPQLHGEFIPYLSVVDLIVNCGPESRRFLESG